MTLWEVLCAMWLISTVSASSVYAWSTAATVLSSVKDLQIADDCALQTAERMMAGMQLPSEFLVDGRRCRIEVMYDQGPNHMQTEIMSSCGSVSDQIWIGET